MVDIASVVVLTALEQCLSKFIFPNQMPRISCAIKYWNYKESTSRFSAE